MTLASVPDFAPHPGRAGTSGPDWTALARRGLGLSMPFLVPLLIVAVWWWAAEQRLLARQILPHPSLVAATGWKLLVSGKLFGELSVSAGRVLAGLAIGGGLGLAVGLACGLSQRFEAYVSPTIRAIWLVPMLGWLPFLMLVLGIGEALKISMIAKTCFLPLMVNAYQGVRSVPRRYIEVADVLELGRLNRLRLVILPAIAPVLFTGLRLALSKGWKALVVVELVASAAGIGYLMSWGRTLFQLDVVMVTMIAIGLVGFTLDHGLAIIDRRLSRWSVKSAG